MEVKIAKTKEGDIFEKSVDALSNVVGKVGWFENSRYPDKNSTPVASVAAIQEEGDPENNIPARPFIAPTVHKEGAQWKQDMISGLRAVFRGKITIEEMLTAVTKRAAGQIRKEIATVTEPPLAEATIQARLNRIDSKMKVPKKLLTKNEAKLRAQLNLNKKGKKLEINLFTKPLVDTGYMRESLTNKVGPE